MQCGRRAERCRTIEWNFVPQHVRVVADHIDEPQQQRDEPLGDVHDLVAALTTQRLLPRGATGGRALLWRRGGEIVAARFCAAEYTEGVEGTGGD